MTATTNDPLDQGVDHCRDQIRTALARESVTSHDLAHLVNQFARAEGVRDVQRELRMAQEHQASHETIRGIVGRLLLSPLDDDWAGRTGDAARSRFVGRQGEVKAILTAIDNDYIDSYLHWARVTPEPEAEAEDGSAWLLQESDPWN